MNDEKNETRERSWLERLGHALLGEPKDRQELLEMIRGAEERDLLDLDALGMIEGVLQVSDMQARDIMVPRSQMVVIQKDDPLEKILPMVIESAHSRFPVVGEDRDEVVGILLAKDLLKYSFQFSEQPFNIRDVLRGVTFIPESKRLDVLLREFRSSRSHIAIVVDEYGGVAGLVTIEDVLEQIVGEIEDEHDIEEDTLIRRHSHNLYTIKALTPIKEFNTYFQAELDEESFDTLGGFVAQAFGHLPKRGEVIEVQGFRFKVLQANQRRIQLLQMSVMPKREPKDE